MKWIRCLARLLMCGLAMCELVAAQQVRRQSAAERVHGIWQKRVKEFEQENRALKKNVVLLGDSITEGFDVKKYFPGKPVLNRGIGSDVIGMENDPLGEGVRGVMSRLKVSVFDCCTTHVFMMIGINDLGDGRTPDEMLKGYRRLVEAIQRDAPGVTIHIESLLPTRARYAHHNPNVRTFNALLRQLAAEMRCPYMDLHALYADDKGELRAEFTRDGLHLKPDAYALWKREIDHAMSW
jgi:lysophospholipase L1-like esterase